MTTDEEIKTAIDESEIGAWIKFNVKMAEELISITKKEERQRTLAEVKEKLYSLRCLSAFGKSKNGNDLIERVVAEDHIEQVLTDMEKVLR